MNKDKVLLELSHRLEAKYGVKPEIFHEKGYIEIKNASKPDGPIIPEEVEAIVKEVMKQFNLRGTELAYSTSFGNITIGFSNE